MKTIGLLGGMSWESTLSYYQTINRVVARELGGLRSAKILLYSVDFHEIEQLQQREQWEDAGQRLAAAARALEAGGADFLVLCTNTMHRVARQIENAVSLPLLHIADPTAECVLAERIERVGLLGTRFTMEQPFYRDRLESKFGLRVQVPGEAERAELHRIIYDELCHGKLVDASRDYCRQLVAGLVAGGCQGVVLGCTEIGLLLKSDDTPVPLFDTAELHAEAAARRSLHADEQGAQLT